MIAYIYIYIYMYMCIYIYIYICTNRMRPVIRIFEQKNAMRFPTVFRQPLSQRLEDGS